MTRGTSIRLTKDGRKGEMEQDRRTKSNYLVWDETFRQTKRPRKRDHGKEKKKGDLRRKKKAIPDEISRVYFSPTKTNRKELPTERGTLHSAGKTGTVVPYPPPPHPRQVKDSQPKVRKGPCWGRCIVAKRCSKKARGKNLNGGEECRGKVFQTKAGEGGNRLVSFLLSKGASGHAQTAHSRLGRLYENEEETKKFQKLTDCC